MNTPILIAGDVTLPSFITRNLLGISAPQKLKKLSCAKTQLPIGTQKLLRLVVSEIGSITILTGLSLVIAIGELRFQSGVVRMDMKNLLVQEKNYKSEPVAISLILNSIAHMLMT